MAPQELEKKGGLTLEKLISYDDVITDALVDKVAFSPFESPCHGRVALACLAANGWLYRFTSGPQ